jgi:hypothetical protein
LYHPKPPSCRLLRPRGAAASHHRVTSTKSRSQRTTMAAAGRRGETCIGSGWTLVQRSGIETDWAGLCTGRARYCPRPLCRDQKRSAILERTCKGAEQLSAHVLGSLANQGQAQQPAPSPRGLEHIASAVPGNITCGAQSTFHLSHSSFVNQASLVDGSADALASQDKPCHGTTDYLRDPEWW